MIGARFRQRVAAAFDRRFETVLERVLRPALEDLLAGPGAANVAAFELMKAALRVAARDQVLTIDQVELVLNNAATMIRQLPDAALAEKAEALITAFSHEFTSRDRIILQ